MGYCSSSTYKFKTNGWRIAYIEGNTAYLISAGSPECMCTSQTGSISNSSCSDYDTTEGAPLHVQNLNNLALKYCNPNYAYGGICNTSSAWNINASDFKKITGSELNANSCYSSIRDTKCGYGNGLIDNGGMYWYATARSGGAGATFNWTPSYSMIGSGFSRFINGIRPVIRLKSTVLITGGTGTYQDPYTIAVNGGSEPVQPTSVTVTYNTLGGNACSSPTKGVNIGSTYGNMCNPTRTGYTFQGWYTSETGGTKVESTTTVSNTSDHTLYARWTPAIYTVTLNNQSATTAGTSTIYYQYNTTKTVNGVTCYYYTDSSLSTCLSGGYTINKPTKTGYTFGGYFTETNGGGTQYTDTEGSFINNIYATTGNKTLYAKWTVNTYYFDVNPDSGISSFDISGVVNPGTNLSDYYQQNNYGTTATITNVKAKTGYTYTGYTLSGSLTAASGSTNNSIKATLGAGNGAVALNSQANKYTMTYNNNGGSGCSSKTVTYGSQYGSLCTPTRSGYTFIGWFDSNYKDEPLNYYADTYADLKNAFGYNQASLYTHWNDHGKGEGRRASQYAATDTVNKTSNFTVYAGWYVADCGYEKHDFSAQGSTLQNISSFTAGMISTWTDWNGHSHNTGYVIYCRKCHKSAYWYDRDNNWATSNAQFICPNSPYCNPSTGTCTGGFVLYND